ncbi:MAG TPA: S8 family serine peptidase [Solirubrobacteraceae bacterium]
MRSTTLALISAALLSLGAASTAHAATSFQAAATGYGSKLPAEFDQRLKYALPDGTLRVIVATERRDAVVESFVADSTTWVQWYGDSPRFLARVTPTQLERLLASSAITFVEPDYKIKSLMSGATLDTHARSSSGDGTGVWSFDPAGGPFGALRPDATGLTADGATGKGVTTAIIDSGIDATHKDFGGWDCTPEPYAPCESRIKRKVVVDHLVGDGFDGSLQSAPTTELASGHGTHVAGIIAGNGYYTRDGDVDPARYGGDGYVFGVAPQSEIVSIKNGDSQWAGLSSFGLEWLIDHGAEYGVRAVNNSWGCIGGCAFDGNSATAQQIRDLYRAGILVAFAAGNDGGGEDGAALAGNAQSPYALGVANYDHANHQLAASSSRGQKAGTGTLADPATWTPESEGVNGVRRPDVAAPGTNIWAAHSLTGGTAAGVPRVNTNDVTGGGSNGFVPYIQMTGTSMATPHVVGASAVLFSACPSASVLDVMRAVMAGAVRDRVTKTGSTTVAEPFEVGYGGLDVRRSLDWLRAQAACGGAAANTAPTATITSADSVRNFEAVAFDAGSSTDADGTIASYTWDFGDGTTATGANPSHSYDWPGAYEVRLTVADDDGATATTTRSIAVRDEAAAGKQRVAAAKDGVKCSSSAWTLTATKAGAAAPSRIAVTWADGSRALLGLSSTSANGTATYTTTEHLQSALSTAKADLPLGWGGSFELASGPFCAKR